MSTSITLIQPQEVVNDGILNGAPISDRFDAALLAAHVKPAELRFFRSIVCEEFYLYMIAEKENEISNYNPDICPVVEAYPNNSVLENFWTQYARPFLSYCVLFQSLPFIGMQLGSNGIIVNSTQFGQPQGKDGIKFLQDTLLNTIEILGEEMRRHLCENKNIYPLVCFDCICKCDCNNTDCNECSRSKPHAPKMGIVFYNKEKKYDNKNDLF